MAEKRFYWIKLKTDFFSLNEIDFLLSQKNGCEYVVLYQMLCLNTANSQGSLMTKIGEMIIPYDVEKIVRDTKYFDFDTVAIALELFKKLGLVYESDNEILRITNYSEMVGSEVANSNAQRQRKYRERQKQLKNVTESVTNNNGSNVTHDVTNNKKGVTQNVTESVTTMLPIVTKSLESRVKSLDNRDIDNRDIDNKRLNDKTIKRYNDKTACANFITKRLFDDYLIDENEFDEFDKMINDYIENYDPVNVLVKSKYILCKIADKSINNRRAYFYKAMKTNLEENYSTNKQADELGIDIDELNEYLKQFE